MRLLIFAATIFVPLLACNRSTGKLSRTNGTTEKSACSELQAALPKTGAAEAWQAFLRAVEGATLTTTNAPCVSRLLDDALDSAKNNVTLENVQFIASDSLTLIETRLAEIQEEWLAKTEVFESGTILKPGQPLFDIASTRHLPLNRTAVLRALFLNLPLYSSDELRAAISHARYTASDLMNPTSVIINPLETYRTFIDEALFEVGDKHPSLHREMAILITHFAVANAFNFSARGKVTSLVKLDQYIALLEGESPSADIRKTIAQARLKRDAVATQDISIAALLLSTRKIIQSHFADISDSEMDAIWNQAADAQNESTLWNSLDLREGDIWLRTSEMGVGTLFSTLSGSPKLATHSGIVATDVESGLKVYFTAEISYQYAELPIDFTHEIIVRPKFSVRPGLTSQALNNLKHLPGKVRFDSLFTPGYDPLGKVHYLYCSEFVHHVFADQFDPLSLASPSPFDGTPVQIPWATEKLLQNAVAVGYPAIMNFYIPSSLFFSPTTALVGSVFRTISKAPDAKHKLSDKMRNLFHETLFKLLRTEKLKQPTWKEHATIYSALTAYGILQSMPSLKSFVPASLVSSTQVLETLNMPPDGQALTLKTFFTIQTILDQIDTFAAQYAGSPDEGMKQFQSQKLSKIIDMFESTIPE